MKKVLILSCILTLGVNADEIKFGFKNPSFSGVGTGAHYLTIENQEFSRKKQIEDALESARKAEREAENTTRLQNLLETWRAESMLSSKTVSRIHVLK